MAALRGGGRYGSHAVSKAALDRSHWQGHGLVPLAHVIVTTPPPALAGEVGASRFIGVCCCSAPRRRPRPGRVNALSTCSMSCRAVAIEAADAKPREGHVLDRFCMDFTAPQTPPRRPFRREPQTHVSRERRGESDRPLARGTMAPTGDGRKPMLDIPWQRRVPPPVATAPRRGLDRFSVSTDLRPLRHPRRARVPRTSRAPMGRERSRASKAA